MKKFSTPGFLALAALALAACGGSDSVAVEAPPITPTPIVQPADAATIVPVANQSEAETNRTPVTTIAAASGAVALTAEDGGSSFRGIAVRVLMDAGYSEADASCIADKLDYTDPRILDQDPEAVGPAFIACGLVEG